MGLFSGTACAFVFGHDSSTSTRLNLCLECDHCQSGTHRKKIGKPLQNIFL